MVTETQSRKTLLVKAEIAYGVSISDLVEAVVDDIVFLHDTYDVEESTEEMLEEIYPTTSNDLVNLGVGYLADVLKEMSSIPYREWLQDRLTMDYTYALDYLDHCILTILPDMLEDLPEDITTALQAEVRHLLEDKLEDKLNNLNNTL